MFGERLHENETKVDFREIREIVVGSQYNDKQYALSRHWKPKSGAYIYE